MTTGKPLNRRVVSVWLPRFPTDRLTSGAPDRLLATVEQVRGGHRLAAVSPAAARAGLAPGLPLADARALVPALEVADADPAAEARALERLAVWAGRYSPWTAMDGNDGLWLDIGGCAHLFGGEAALLADLRARLAQAGYTARAGLADTPGAAWALARFAPDTLIATPIAAPGRTATRDALAPLPVAALRLAPETVETLVRLGLGHIGDLIPLARAALALRAGLQPALRLDQALGDRDEPLSPLMPAPLLQTRLAFPDPIGRAEDIAAALDRLLAALCARLARAGRGARRLDFSLYRVDGTVARLAVGTGRPSRDPAHLATLFREKLADVDPGFGIETAVLAARAVDALGARQEVLDGGTEGGEALDRLLDRLGNRLGPARVGRLAPRASHLPERAQALVPAETAESPEKAPQTASVRPVHLLPMAEPVDVMTAEPLGPPAALRWRGREHRIARAEGPERIAPEWWHGDGAGGPSGENTGERAPTRDYYRVEDTAGGRFWLYRLAPALPGQAPRWFLHGLFA